MEFLQNLIIMIILLAILTPAILYLIRAKKKGHSCIGCPCAGQCAKCVKPETPGKDSTK